MRVQRGIQQSRIRQERDRAAWTGSSQVLIELQTNGVGEITTDEIDFGVVFTKRPFFTWHVELVTGALVAGDFPSVSAFVTDWSINSKGYYVGAIVSVRVSSVTQYNLGFMLSFVGESFRGPVK